MDSLNKSLGKVSIGVPTKPSIFTFVPVVQTLPIGSTFTEEERSGALTGKPSKNSAASLEETSRGTMSDRDSFKAETVVIKGSAKGGAGNQADPPGTKLQPSLDHASFSQTKASPSVDVQSENTLHRVTAGTDSMEIAVDKHRGISQRRCHDTSGLSEVSSGYFTNRASVSEDRTSPTNSADLFPTPASSRESLLSEGSDREKSWSAMQLSYVTSPASLSRTVSPCSSVRSGVFSPAVVQIKRHFLAPGSSLVHTPVFSSCESLSSSICPQSPPPPPRHRPPLTRLALLTAILRKGRLPVLSSALQRPYTPCWPVNPVTLTFCNACSAASSVASIPLLLSSRFSSSASIDSQSHVHREPNRCVTAPPPVQSNELNGTCLQTQAERCSEQIFSSSVPRREQVISPLAVKRALPRVPSLFCAKFKSVSPPKHDEIDYSISKKLAHMSISKTAEMKPIITDMYHKAPSDNNVKYLISPPGEVIYERETSAPQKWSRPPNSSLSRLRSLSQQLRSPPVCPPQLRPPQPRSPGVTVVCEPARNSAGRCASGRGRPDSKRATTPADFHKAHCLSPSRYAPIAFTGWASPTSSPTPTPTPTPSPAPPIRDFTPSPSLSMRSTPSPRPGSGISDCSDREGKKRKTHKIKLSYKSLAAIPTNTLLLDQQVIDEEVEREESPCDSLHRGVDTHAEMCSPAELRQQSEELYAVIDEILADSIPTSKSSRSQEPSRSSTPNTGLQNNSSFTKSLGRETKYISRAHTRHSTSSAPQQNTCQASVCSLHPSTCVERKLVNPKKTKPGVIRPMTAIPRLTVDEEEEFHPNPFRQSERVWQTSADNKKVDRRQKDFYASPESQSLREERKPERRGPSSVCDLQITEPDERVSAPVKDASASFSPTEGRMEASETHI